MTHAWPFHDGELAVQERAGVREKVAAAGERMIRAAMPEQHIELFERLPTMFVGSLDEADRPWGSVLVGAPGFIRAPHERALRIAALPDAADPLSRHLRVGARLGLLGLEPHTRRRNRMNGRVIACDASGFTVEVEQSFGNCPKYIQAREPRWAPQVAGAAAQPLGSGLNDAACALLARADTLFIASSAPAPSGHGADVSHRGGKPGFVRVEREEASGAVVLTLPDFAGNKLFNTLGNIAAHPWAGLLVIDYENGDVLQLSASARIVWDEAAASAIAGAQRLLRLRGERGWWRPGALPLRWSAPAYSPQLEGTGRWACA